jgi:hypothetical protein
MNKKLVFLLLLVTFSSTQLFSQLSLSGQTSYMRLFGNSNLNSIGFGMKMDYSNDEESAISLGINYHLPFNFSKPSIAYANNYTVSPSSIEYTNIKRISIINLSVAYKHYFLGDYVSDFGMYGIAEIGVFLIPISSSTGDFDHTKYYTDDTENYNITIPNFTANAGFGAEKKINLGYLFYDTKLNIPVNQLYEDEVEVQIPLSLCINAGIRFTFD